MNIKRPSERDTVSLAYPNFGFNSGSSAFYASLSSKAHRVNGTKKTRRFGDDSSINHGSLMDDELQGSVLDSEEEERRAKKEFELKYYKKEGDSIINQLKQKVSLGVLKPNEMANQIGPKPEELKLNRISSMVTVKHDKHT